MSSLSITAKVRTEGQLGTKAVRRMRAGTKLSGGRSSIDGRIPAVLYGNKETSIHLSVEEKEIRRLTGYANWASAFIDLDVEGQKHKVLLKSVQWHAYKTSALHADFLRVTGESVVELAVPLHFSNIESCVGVKTQGGTFIHLTTQVTIRVKMDSVPQEISVDVSHLEVGQTLHLSDLPQLTGVKYSLLLSGHDEAICQVQAAATEEETPVTDKKPE